ncbi:MAG: nitroreductase family protein [Microbacterium sp.]
MGTTTLSRTAPTATPILDVLAERWSPRAYSDAPIDEQKLRSALEAASWSPSEGNKQEWRFIVARRGSDAHAKVVETLAGFNQLWAPLAGALIVAVAEVENEEGAPNTVAQYDLGQAMAHFSVQAHADGLLVHQMTGFSAPAIAEAFELPARFVPVSVTAVGELGNLSVLPEKYQGRESDPRVRRPVSESLLVDD